MSAEPILVTDRAPRMSVRVSKIHKAEGGAICFGAITRADARTTAIPMREKPVDGFQHVDESLGISESLANGAILQRISFF
jgi:hypothetical protein